MNVTSIGTGTRVRLRRGLIGLGTLLALALVSVFAVREVRHSSRAVPITRVERSGDTRFRALKERQAEQRDPVAPAMPPISDWRRAMREQEARRDAATPPVPAP